MKFSTYNYIICEVKVREECAMLNGRLQSYTTDVRRETSIIYNRVLDGRLQSYTTVLNMTNNTTGRLV